MTETTGVFINDVIDVDLTDLRAELLKIPADLARYNAQYATAHRVYQQAKYSREYVYSEIIIDRAFLDNLEARLGKKPNLDQVKAAAVIHPAFEEAKEREIAAEAKLKKLAGCVEAIKEKARMVQMATALIRDELNIQDAFSD